MRWNVAVVGGSIAGSSLAYFLAKEGVDVLVIEKNNEIGLKPCAGYIPRFLFKYFEIDGIKTKIKEMKTVFPSGKEYFSSMHGFIVDRRTFDRGVAEQACAEGAEYIIGERVIKVHGNNIYTTKDKFEADIIVGCDGINSLVANEIAGVQDPSLYAITVQYEMVLRVEDPSIASTFFNVNYAPGSYVWLYPTSEKSAKVGLGIVPKLAKKSAKEYLDKFVREKLKGAKKIAFSSAPLPLYALRRRLVKENMLLIGDSASTTDPISGAGISSAVLSSRIACKAIVRALEKGSFKELEFYERKIRQLLGKRLNHSLNKRKIVNKAYSSNELLESMLKKTWIAFDEYWQDLTKQLSHNKKV